jgi:hypothetical protein
MEGKEYGCLLRGRAGSITTYNDTKDEEPCRARWASLCPCAWVGCRMCPLPAPVSQAPPSHWIGASGSKHTLGPLDAARAYL